MSKPTPHSDPSADPTTESTEACPVTVLGHRGKVFFYLGASGEMRGLLPSEHNEANLEALFGGRLEWMLQAFPSPKKAGYNLNELRSWLYRLANIAGFFDPDRNLRGPGTWRDDRGRLIVHCGDEVMIDGEWQAAGFKKNNVVYTCAPVEARPAKDAAPAAAARELLGFMEMWCWCGPRVGSGSLAARLALGWIGCAFVTGALHWRPHILVTGARGTGKTYLNNLVECVLSPEAIYKASAPSAAGIRQALAGAARPVMLDEIEHDPDNRRATDLIELARLGSSDGQGAVVRGSAEGRAQAWAIRACFCFSAIEHPVFKPQDASRITVLELGPLQRDPEAAALARERIQAFADVGPALRARMIDGFDRFKLNLEVYAQALSAASADGRQCDQLGSLLAAADVLTRDEVTPFHEAERFAEPIMRSEYIPGREEDGHAECLNHLLSTAIEVQLGTNYTRQRRTLGELVGDQLRDPTRETQRILATYGISMRERSGVRYLAVANKHRELQHIFAGTRWHTGVWRVSLARTPLSLRPDKPFKFAGATSRAVWIPETALSQLDIEDDANSIAAGESIDPDGDTER